MMKIPVIIVPEIKKELNKSNDVSDSDSEKLDDPQSTLIQVRVVKLISHE